MRGQHAAGGYRTAARLRAGRDSQKWRRHALLVSAAFRATWPAGYGMPTRVRLALTPDDRAWRALEVQTAHCRAHLEFRSECYLCRVEREFIT